MTKVVFVVLCSFLSPLLWAQDGVNTQVVRHINRMIQAQTVQVIMNWEKNVHVRDLLTRPARGKAGDTVVSVKTKTTYCRGHYSSEKQIYFPMACMLDDEFTLSRVTLVLPNGQKWLPAKKELRTDKNKVWVTVP